MSRRIGSILSDGGDHGADDCGGRLVRTAPPVGHQAESDSFGCFVENIQVRETWVGTLPMFCCRPSMGAAAGSGTGFAPDSPQNREPARFRGESGAKPVPDPAAAPIDG